MRASAAFLSLLALPFSQSADQTRRRPADGSIRGSDKAVAAKADALPSVHDTHDLDMDQERRLVSEGNSYVFLSPAYNLLPYDDLLVTFQFTPFDLRNSETFALEFSDDNGASWTPVTEFVNGINDIAARSFMNGMMYTVRVFLSEHAAYSPAEVSRIRLRCDACAEVNGGQVSVSEFNAQGLVRLSGRNIPPASSSSPSNSPTDEPTNTPTLQPVGVPTSLPTPYPTSEPTVSPTATPTSSPASSPTSTPTSVPTSLPTPAPKVKLTFESVCPIRRQNPPMKYEIQPFTDPVPRPIDAVEDDIAEMSYIVFSEQRSPNGNRYAYTASDKEQFSIKVLQFTDHPDGAHYSGDGNVVAVYKLDIPHPTNDDWEDISLGPCTDSDDYSMYTTIQTCVYVGNIGNNERRNRVVRDVVSIFKFVEPVIGPEGPRDQIVPVARINFRYGAGFGRDTYDSEALFVDWTGDSDVPGDNPGDVYVATKSGGCRGGVGKIPVSVHKNLAPGTETSAFSMPNILDRPSPQLSIECSDGPYRSWTGSDMRRDGRLIAMIRNGPPASAYFFPRLPGESVATALGRPSCDYVSSTSRGLPNEKKHEAVAFVGNDRFVDLSECDRGRDCVAPAYFHTLIFPSTAVPVVDEPPSGWVTITSDDFESNDWGSYRPGGRFSRLRNTYDTGGGDNCNGYCACDGFWAAELSDDEGVQSSFEHTSRHDCSDYDILRVSFKYKSRSYDHLDTLFLEISLDGGANYHMMATWANEVDNFFNARCYQANVLMTPSQLHVTSFGSDVRLRFRNSGNAGNDRVYVDAIKFEGHV